MQTIEDVFSSAITDARSLVNDITPTIQKDIHKVGGFLRDGEHSIRKEARNLRRSASKDLRHARKFVKHGINSAESTVKHIRKNLHSDWNKLDSFTRRELNNVSNAIDNGVSDVSNEWGKFTNWVDGAVSGAESDVIVFLIVGGVLLYIFREPIGTGAKYLFNEGKSTAKTAINNAAAAAPYAAPLLLV